MLPPKLRCKVISTSIERSRPTLTGSNANVDHQLSKSNPNQSLDKGVTKNTYTLVVLEAPLLPFLLFLHRDRLTRSLVRLVVQLSFEDNRSSPSSLASSHFLRPLLDHILPKRRRRRRVMQSGGGVGGGTVITALATLERNRRRPAKNPAPPSWRWSAIGPA